MNDTSENKKKKSKEIKISRQKEFDKNKENDIL